MAIYIVLVLFLLLRKYTLVRSHLEGKGLLSAHNSRLPSIMVEKTRQELQIATAKLLVIDDNITLRVNGREK